MAPDSPRLSPLGGAMASVIPAALAPQPPISFTKRKMEFFLVAPTEVPKVIPVKLALDTCCSLSQSLWPCCDWPGLCHLLCPGSRLQKRGWFLGRQTAKRCIHMCHCIHMCLWAKGLPHGIPPGLAEVGEILMGLCPGTLPFAHQAKWREKKERF